VSSDYDPDSHPAVQAARAAYTRAYVGAELEAAINTKPGTLDGYVAYSTEHRLYLADRAYHDARHAANREAHPELYRDGPGPGVWTIDDWRARYPDLRLADLAGPETEADVSDPEVEP
jgi:hypothetical protein